VCERGEPSVTNEQENPQGGRPEEESAAPQQNEPLRTDWSSRADYPFRDEWQPEPPKQRRSLVFPLVLITIGILAILHNFGLIQVDFWFWLWRLWPVWLIIAGLDLVFGGRKRWFGWIAFGLVITVVGGAIWGAQSLWFHIDRPGAYAAPGQSIPLDHPLQDAKEAEIQISPGITRLTVGATQSAEKLAEGQLGVPPAGMDVIDRLDRSGDKAILHLEMRGNMWNPFGNWAAPAWQVNLSKAIPLRIRVDAGVGETDLDLRELKVVDLDVNSGVGQSTVTLPREGKLRAAIDMGVGRLHLRIPRSMGAAISVDKGLGRVNLMGQFEARGKEYVTPGYSASPNQAEIRIHGGVGEIEVELID
jgi:hypothetical protein